MRTLVCLALFVLGTTCSVLQFYIIATSLVCPNDKYYVSVLKKSGSGGALETYVISGIFSEQSTVLATGNAVPAGQNATQEFCLDMTSDGVYTIELKHSYFVIFFFKLQYERNVECWFYGNCKE